MESNRRRTSQLQRYDVPVVDQRHPRNTWEPTRSILEPMRTAWKTCRRTGESLGAGGTRDIEAP